jgi:hypothetical protein
MALAGRMIFLFIFYEFGIQDITARTIASGNRGCTLHIRINDTICAALFSLVNNFILIFLKIVFGVARFSYYHVFFLYIMRAVINLHDLLADSLCQYIGQNHNLMKIEMQE